MHTTNDELPEQRDRIIIYEHLLLNAVLCLRTDKWSHSNRPTLTQGCHKSITSHSFQMSKVLGSCLQHCTLDPIFLHREYFGSK